MQKSKKIFCVNYAPFPKSGHIYSLLHSSLMRLFHCCRLLTHSGSLIGMWGIVNSGSKLVKNFLNLGRNV